LLNNELENVRLTVPVVPDAVRVTSDAFSALNTGHVQEIGARLKLVALVLESMAG